MNVLVTGANGFVGAAVCRRLLAQGHAVIGAVRRPDAELVPGVQQRLVESLGPDTRWAEALTGIDAVIHLAARVHVMADTAADPLSEFRRTNTEGTLHLAREAARLGVQRLVFVSSIKVNGEATAPEQPFRADDSAAPLDPYGQSKAEAETGLREITHATGLTIAILRPPLVYGAGVGGNFRTLLKAVQRGLPLPLGAIDNRRSLIHVDNLADSVACVLQKQAAGRCGTYLLADGEDVSTAELVRRIARAMNRPARLIPVPVALLRLLGRLTGRSGAIDRLTGSLQVDASVIRDNLGWVPPVRLDDGLAQTVAWFTRRR
ncbi:MAG TPA: NAD-dependent epimerase/dehydratase family protein [Patescibacteria group bacterium]|nr:NAD-dependent epimerase/dehydratase family protein [Patescibacteria group bacterium]